MNDYIKKNGSKVTVYSIIGDDIISRVVDNTSNIEEILANQNRLEPIKNAKENTESELRDLYDNRDSARIINVLSLIAGIMFTLVAKLINVSNFDFIPYGLGIITIITPIIYFNTFGMILEYYDKHKKLEDEIISLDKQYKHVKDIEKQLEHNAKKVTSFSKCMPLSDSKSINYNTLAFDENRLDVENSEDIKTVQKFKTIDSSIDFFNRYSKELDNNMEQQRLSLEETNNLFENEIKSYSLQKRRYIK